MTDRYGQQATETDRYKQQAAEGAVELIASGMVVGLGTGETATYAIRRIGALLRAGTLKDIEGVATSLATAAEAVPSFGKRSSLRPAAGS